MFRKIRKLDEFNAQKKLTPRRKKSQKKEKKKK